MKGGVEMDNPSYNCPFVGENGGVSSLSLGYKWDRKGNIKITNQATIDICLECPLAKCRKKGTK